MYPRRLALPQRSFFLFGPRGTGKTTWLRAVLPDAAWYNLLHEREMLRLMRDPDRFRQELEALPAGSWVVVDEVQKLPALLSEVHDSMATHAGRNRFALSGSSARRLKRDGADMLPGRVVNRRFFPLAASEVGFDVPVADLLGFGALPAVRMEPTRQGRVDLLEAYVENYVVQEVRLEALVRSLESFTRFLEVAALANGQVTNVAGIARDAAVARPTVQGYFDVLVDTLLGVWLPAWRRSARIKEVAHPKFYFFDPGVARALAGRVRDPCEPTERGALLETWILHELRAWMSCSDIGGQLCYWRTPSGGEVDFVWSRASRAVGIEVKAASRWRGDFGRSLRELVGSRVLSRGFGVYLGEQALRDGDITVLPVMQFLRRLSRGEVLGD